MERQFKGMKRKRSAVAPTSDKVQLKADDALEENEKISMKDVLNVSLVPTTFNLYLFPFL